MNKFILYLANKYDFNPDYELNLYKESVPAKSKDEIFEYMLHEICLSSGIPKEEVVGRSRKREIMYARHLLVYSLYSTNSFSLNDIGKRLGDRNHATIINSKYVVEDLVSVKDSLMYPLYLKIKHLINEDNISRSSDEL